GKDLLGGGDEAGRPVGDDQQRRSQPARGEVGEEVVPGVGRFGRGGGQADEDRFAVAGDAPGGQYRLGPAAVVHLEVGGVQEQVVQRHRAQVTAAPGFVLRHDGLADGRASRFGQGGFGAERGGECAFDVTHAQAAHERGDDQGLQGVGAGDAGAEQAGGELLGGAAQFGAGDGDRPGGGFDGGRAVPVAVAGPYRGLLLAAVGCDGGGALVASPAEERVHLGFDGGLDDQAGAEPGDVFENLDEITIGGEQGVDLGADGLNGR